MLQRNRETYLEANRILRSSTKPDSNISTVIKQLEQPRSLGAILSVGDEYRQSHLYWLVWRFNDSDHVDCKYRLYHGDRFCTTCRHAGIGCANLWLSIRWQQHYLRSSYSHFSSDRTALLSYLGGWFN